MSARHSARLLALVLLTGAGPLLSAPSSDGARAGSKDRQQGISEAEAADRVRTQTGGRVLRVDKVGQNHRVKVLTPRGEVRQVLVPSKDR